MQRLQCLPAGFALAVLVRAVLVGALLIPAVAWGQPPAGTPGSTFLLSTGVVVRGDGSELFLMRPEGGVEAVDVGLGRTLWTTEAASQPLAGRGNLLLARADSPGRGRSVGLLLLDMNRGTTRREVPLDLPEELWTGIDDGLGASLSVESWDAAPDLLIHWACREQPVGGAAMARPPAREARGAARLDTANGRLERLEAGAVTPPGGPDLLVPESDRLAALEGRQFRSVDGRHILVSERIADDRTWEKYRWTFFDSASGERLGEIASRWSVTEFFVAGNSVVHLAPAYQRRLGNGRLEDSPRSVRAVDLASGTELWRRSLRETRYRGPFPP